MSQVLSEEPRAVAHVRDLRARIEAALQAAGEAKQPEALYEPVRYVLAGRGKRFRPIMLLLAAEAFGAPPERAMPAALAVEIFHNFTLVHDDIMDGADERRGRAAVHVRWDESTAILCGDYLMALSYGLLAQVQTSQLPRLLGVFHRMIVALCEGQALDKAFETRAEVSVQEYLEMIDRKTGALLQTSLVLGGLVGEADEAHLAMLRDIGTHVGRAFQIQDDLLDLIARDARWGKAIGGDLVTAKKTFLLLRTLERAEGAERAWFERIVREGGLAEAEVPEARARMDRLGVLDEAREAVLRHSNAAAVSLGTLPATHATDTLSWLIEQMQARLH